MLSNLMMAASDIGWTGVLLAVGLFLVTFAGSLATVAFLLVRMPADFFVARRRGEPRRPTTFLGWTRRIAKNLLGAFLVLLGFMLSLPGIPGQGLLTILLGVMLLEFPGKRRIERRIISRPRILQVVNGLRARFDRPPVVIPPSNSSKSAQPATTSAAK